MITLTYQASERAEASYGLMGVSKSALESAVRYLALELGRNKIRVNALSPGPIETVAATGIMGAFLRNPEALERQRARAFQEAIEMATAENHPDALAVASAAWKHFQDLVAKRCAIEETVSKEDVADSALFLGSDYSRKITGQIDPHRLRPFDGQRPLTRNIQIVPFRLRHLDRILSDRARQFRQGGVAAQYFLELYGDCAELFVVAKVAGASRATWSACVEKRNAEIVSIAVHPDYRRQGVADALMRHTLRALRSGRRSSRRIDGANRQHRGHGAIPLPRLPQGAHGAAVLRGRRRWFRDGQGDTMRS